MGRGARSREQPWPPTGVRRTVGLLELLGSGGAVPSSRWVVDSGSSSPIGRFVRESGENRRGIKGHTRGMERGKLVKTLGWPVALLLLAATPATPAIADDPGFTSQVVALVQDGSSLEVVSREVDSLSEQRQVVKRLESDPDVQAIDVGFHEVSILADPYTPQQWPYRVLDFPESRRYADGSGATVAVLDTGVAANHKDLAGVVDTQRSFSTVPSETDIIDRHGHGTHVTGIIAAQVNGRGVEGLAPETTVVAGKVLGEDGGGDMSYVVEGIIRAADLGVDVISLSLGTSEYSDVLAASVDYAVSKGCLVIAAAGNEGHTGNLPSYPAALDNVFAVGATAADDSVAFFSNHGPYVDIAAPGLAVLSTVPSNPEDTAVYQYMSGTSMATPYVSAATALLLSADPRLNAQDVREALVATAKDIRSPGTDDYSGAGRVVPAAAVALVTGRQAPLPPPAWIGPVPDMDTLPSQFIEYPKYEVTLRPHVPTVMGTRYDYDAFKFSITATKDGLPAEGETDVFLKGSNTGTFDPGESGTPVTLHNGSFDGVVPLGVRGEPSSFVILAEWRQTSATAQVTVVPQAVVHVRKERITANIFPLGVDCGGFEVHRRVGKGPWLKAKAGEGAYPFRYRAKRKAKVLKRSKWQVRINTCDALTGDRQMVSPTFKLSLRKSHRKTFRF